MQTARPLNTSTAALAALADRRDALLDDAVWQAEVDALAAELAKARRADLVDTCFAIAATAARNVA